jgi:hypothetical protein
MFESKLQPVVSRVRFQRRLVFSAVFAGMIVVGSLAVGTLGYRVFADLGWIDALLNASMILTGMGPVDRMESVAGKLFASFYAIFSGVAFLGTTGILVAPWAHRLLHRFHADLDEEDN